MLTRRANSLIFLVILVRDQEVGGSNPLAPTKSHQSLIQASPRGFASRHLSGFHEVPFWTESPWSSTSRSPSESVMHSCSHECFTGFTTEEPKLCHRLAIIERTKSAAQIAGGESSGRDLNISQSIRASSGEMLMQWRSNPFAVDVIAVIADDLPHVFGRFRNSTQIVFEAPLDQLERVSEVHRIYRGAQAHCAKFDRDA